MCDKAVLENGGRLKSVPDCCKNHKAVDNYRYALEFVSECCRTKNRVIKLSIHILLQ